MISAKLETANCHVRRSSNSVAPRALPTGILGTPEGSQAIGRKQHHITKQSSNSWLLCCKSEDTTTAVQDLSVISDASRNARSLLIVKKHLLWINHIPSIVGQKARQWRSVGEHLQRYKEKLKLTRIKIGIEHVSIILLILIHFGCNKDWLEIKSDKKQTVPETLKDFQGILDASRGSMNNWSVGLGEIASDLYYVTEASWQNANDMVRNAYTWSKERPYRTVLDWNLQYSKIFSCNLVLEGLEKLDVENNGSLFEIANCRGQAFFHRAYNFFDLAQVFAPPFSLSSSQVDLGIPLRLESDITLPSARATIKQTYNQIINDLMIAKDLLPNEPIFKTRPSKISAYALLARVYLTMDMYDSARLYSEKCLQLYNQLIDYNTLPLNGNYIGDFNSNPEVLFHNVIATGRYSGFITSRCLVDTALYSVYDSNDLRRSLCFRVNSNKTISYIGNYNNIMSDLFCGLATDEVYLIRAECNARLGDLISAMDDLNALMIKRWKNNGSWVPFSAVNVDDALSKILLERKKELLFRGLRWHDLRRLNKDNRFKMPVIRQIGGATFRLEPNSYKYTFPIPDDIIEMSGILQNPGW